MQDTDGIREYGKEPEDSWNRLRGILKGVFTELGGVKRPCGDGPLARPSRSVVA